MYFVVFGNVISWRVTRQIGDFSWLQTYVLERLCFSSDDSHRAYRRRRRSSDTDHYQLLVYSRHYHRLQRYAYTLSVFWVGYSYSNKVLWPGQKQTLYWVIKPFFDLIAKITSITKMSTVNNAAMFECNHVRGQTEIEYKMKDKRKEEV